MKQLDLARPYAKAAFEFARDANAFPEWESALALASELLKNHELHEYVQHPLVSKAEAADTVCEMLSKFGNVKSKEIHNFIKTVAYYDRILALPEIFAVFEDYVAQEKEIIRAKASSAVKLTKTQVDQIKSSLKARFGRDVSLEVDVDTSLIGGVKVQVDDWVLDNTIKARLARLSHTLGEQSHE